ncbi:MAG: PKD domain-containing protein [Saprospiraceae bacterium]|nr:PKD domain-containing protein [Candidatus Opimibacter skivensis]
MIHASWLDQTLSTISIIVRYQFRLEDDSRGNIYSPGAGFRRWRNINASKPGAYISEAILYGASTITADNGCTDQICDKLRLGADVCNASFTYVQDGLDIVFNNTSEVSDPSVVANWSFGDGGTSMQYDSIGHTYALGLYEVCVTVSSSGCVSTQCQMLDLTDPCLALRARYGADVDGEIRSCISFLTGAQAR